MGHLLTQSVERQLTHPRHQTALAYWLRCRRLVGGTPGRQDIDPVDMPSLLPWVVLIDVDHQPARLAYRHRLVGTGIVEMRRRDSTGLWFHEVYDPDKLARLEAALSGVVDVGEPALLRDDLRDIGKPHRMLSALVLPLAGDRRRVDMLMAIVQYD